MSLARADILLHLQSQFSALATETGQPTADSATGFGPAIDFALRQTGTLQAGLLAGTIPTGSEDTGLRLAEYAALRRFAGNLAVRVDLEVDAPRTVKKRSQYLANIKELLSQLRDELVELGFLATGFVLGRLSLDFLEPEGNDF